MATKQSQLRVSLSATTNQLPQGTRSSQIGTQRPSTAHALSTHHVKEASNQKPTFPTVSKPPPVPRSKPSSPVSKSRNNSLNHGNHNLGHGSHMEESSTLLPQGSHSMSLSRPSHSSHHQSQGNHSSHSHSRVVSSEGDDKMHHSQSILNTTTLDSMDVFPPGAALKLRHSVSYDEEEDCASATISTTKKNHHSQLMLAASHNALPPDHFSNRLFNTPKWKPKDDQNDAIVSNLSFETLRWIKKRRSMDSNQRVVISYIRNRQLREMFKKLDFNGHGSIELGELTDAINYAKQRITEGDGVKHFQNLDQVFAEMDDNGDGTVDYQEFTKGMTGTSHSVFDKVSSFDIEKLFNLFIEYGEMRSRELAVETIDHKRPMTANAALTVPSSNSASAAKLSTVISKESNPAVDTDDYGVAMYQNFKILFGNNENGKKGSELVDDSGTPICYLGKKKCDDEEKLLDRFILSNQLHSIGCVVNEDSECLGSYSTISGAADEFLREKQYMHVHEKQRLARREMVEDLATDFGILDIQKSMNRELNKKLPKPKKSLPILSFGMNNTTPGNVRPHSSHASTTSKPGKDTLHNAVKTQSDMAIRLQVRKEAFEIMRAGRKQREMEIAQDLHQSSDSTFGTSPKLFTHVRHDMFEDKDAKKELPILQLIKNKGGGGGVKHSENSSTTSQTVHPAMISTGSFIYS